MAEQLQSPPSVATCSDTCDVENGGIKDCAICLDAMDKPNEVCELRCHHTFHLKCCNNYFRGLYISNLDITCPLCRHVLQEQTSPQYILRRLSILQTIPDIHMHMTPPTRIVIPRNFDSCFARTLLCVPLLVLAVFIVVIWIWTHDTRK